MAAEEDSAMLWGRGVGNFSAWLLQKQKEGERPPKEAVSPSEKG